MQACSKFLAALALTAAAATAAVGQGQPVDANSLIEAGARVARIVDEGKAGDLWDGASAVVKQMVPRQRFTDTVAAAREPLGPAASRAWASVTRTTSPGTPELPAGQYVTVQYDTSFGAGKTAKEMISFRLDDDKTWRITGYVIK